MRMRLLKRCAFTSSRDPKSPPNRGCGSAGDKAPSSEHRVGEQVETDGTCAGKGCSGGTVLE